MRRRQRINHGTQPLVRHTHAPQPKAFQTQRPCTRPQDALRKNLAAVVTERGIVAQVEHSQRAGREGARQRGDARCCEGVPRQIQRLQRPRHVLQTGAKICSVGIVEEAATQVQLTKLGQTLEQPAKTLTLWHLMRPRAAVSPQTQLPQVRLPASVQARF